MPSGLSGFEDYSVKVSDCGTKLLLSNIWPNDIISKDILVKTTRQVDPEFTPLHTGVSGIGHALRQLTHKINSMVGRQYYINIPIKVEQLVKFHHALTTKANATILHVRLQGITDDYVQEENAKGAIPKADFYGSTLK